MIQGPIFACRHVCDERWHNVTRSVKEAALGLPPPATLKQPTWCRLQPLRFANVVQRVPAGSAENVLLLYKAAADVAQGLEWPHVAEANQTHRTQAPP